MSIRILNIGISLVVCTLFLSLAGIPAVAETLNPEGINPHAANPRKRITQEQKDAAAEARKKKKAEIEARKAATRPKPVVINPAETGAQPNNK